MAATSSPQGTAWAVSAASAEARAAAWLEALRGRDDEAARAPLGGMHRDPESFDFTRRLLDLVAGTDDAFASAVGLREMAHEVPESMGIRDRLAVRAGGAASLGLPWAVMPVARRWLRTRLSSLVLAAKLPSPGLPDAGEQIDPGKITALAEALRRHRDAGLVPVVAPLGLVVHGPEQAAAEARRLTALAAHPTIGHMRVDPERLVPGGTEWSADADVAAAACALQPILAAAAEHGTTLHIEPQSVRWARLIPDLLDRALADPAFDRARVGTRLLAELPESRELYSRLSRWAQRRVAEGGAPAEVVIGVGGVAGAERIAAITSGLPVPVLEERDAVAAQLLRLAELALHPGRAAVLRPVIASEDPIVLAAVVSCAAELGATGLASLQLRGGVVPGLAEAIVADGGEDIEVRIEQHVVAPSEFAGAVELLVGLAGEAADPESAPSRVDALVSGDENTFAAEWEAHERAFALATEAAPESHRTQLRAREWDPSERDSALFYRSPDEPARFDTGGLTAAVLGLSRGATGAFQLEEFAPPRAIPAVSDSGFANEPGTDASLPANREWMREQLRLANARVGQEDEANATVALSPADLDPERVALAARESGERWSTHGPAARGVRLRRSALALVAARDRLLTVLAADTGAPVAELDAEVNDIVDAARYAGQLAAGLGAVRGASFVSDGLILVHGDAGTPLSHQAEAVFSALGAGAGVLWAVPHRFLGSATALVEECEAGGLTPGAVRIEAVAVEATVAELAAHHEVDRAIVLGAREVGQELARRRPDLRIEGQFRARGTILVAPSADLDHAIADVVASAFRAGGGDPRGAHAVILMGSVARSRRFREGLADAVRALRPGDTARPGDADPLAFGLGPLAEPASGAALRALTELGRGEEWLVQPEQLDTEGRLWSPGVKIGVTEQSECWSGAVAVPVLTVAHAHSLSDALRMQNAPGGGGVAGLQSNDGEEIVAWVEQVSAAALAINRPTSGARIERQPGGGWGDAVMGLPTLAGGPNRLLALGSWEPRPGTRSDTLHLRGLDPEVRLLIEAAQPTLAYEEFDAVRRAALADALVWRTSLGVDRDTIGLGIERNAVRTRSVVTQVRLAEDGPLAALVRVLAAALLVRAPISLSTGQVLPAPVADLLAGQGIEVSLERDDDWMERLAVSGPLGPGELPAARVRLIGGDPVRAAEWMGGLDRAALWADTVTMAGPVELLTLLREQAISARAHRHGLAIPVPGLDEMLEAP